MNLLKHYLRKKNVYTTTKGCKKLFLKISEEDKTGMCLWKHVEVKKILWVYFLISKDNPFWDFEETFIKIK